MCTTSIVRFRFSLKDNCEPLDSLDSSDSLDSLDISDKSIGSIESESKYLSKLSNIRSLGSRIGIKANNEKSIPKDIAINMSKGLANGHQLNDNNNLDINWNNNSQDIDSDSIGTTTSTTAAIPSSTANTGVSAPSDPAMGLLSASSKDSLSQHLLLSSLKSGKPENGQRIDLSTLSWNVLKDTNSETNSVDNRTNDLTQSQTNCENQLEANSLAQNSPLSDHTVDQMIEEVLNKSDSQVRDELSAQPILETNSCEELQNESSLNPEMIDDSNTKSCCEGPDRRTGLSQSSEPIDVRAQQMSLCRQSERLLRRIRRLQFRQTQRHLTKQMKTFVENRQIVLGVGCQRQTEPNASAGPQLSSHATQVEDRMKLLTPEGVKGLSTSALVNLVKRLGNEANHLRDYYPQQTPVRPLPPPQTPSFTSSSHSFGASPQVPQTPINPITGQQLPNSSDESTSVNLLHKSQSQPFQCSTQAQPYYRDNPEEKESIITTIDTLSASLRHFETGFDSDATESSSGGESCDEFEDYNEDSVPHHSTPIHSSGHMFPMRKRSCWKWCVERAAIASRWTWLQAQVADLEFRIRQQNEMYRQLRATKGFISFGTGDHNLTVPTPAVSKANIPSSITTSSATTTSAPTNSQPTENPPNPSQPPTASGSGSGSGAQAPQSTQTGNSESDSHYCMRTLPLNSMRKRKLVRSMNALSGATRKAAKYSTIQCACNGLPNIVWPCVLCNGRYSYVHVIDTDCMPHFERVALLDSSCHPVLSLNNDVSLGLHFTELLKRETIQRPIPSRLQNKKRKSPPSPTLANKLLFDSTKSKSPKRSQSVISSTKLRKKYDGSTKRRYVRRSASGVTGEGVWRKRGRPRERVSSGSSRTESPIPSPVPSDGSGCGNSFSAPLHRRRRSEQHAFDINNIVIPYSIAATTRVEKLQYKEIITPKWRIITESDGQTFRFSLVNNKSESNEGSKESSPVGADEDISDTAFTLRHAKCEEEERKRILAFMKGNTKSGSLRGRGARVRFDSTRSETNTSAADALFHNDSTSQDSYTGPTSAPVLQNCNTEPNIAGTPPPVSERRRNVSLSSRRDDSIDEYFETVTPFELRAFPLNDSEFDIMSKDTQTLCPLEDTIEPTLDSITDPEKSNEGTITANNSRAPTPIDSDGAESIVDHIDVDNDKDPEWEPKK